MKNIALVLAAVAITLLLQAFATPTHAQAIRTWVAASGSDSNTATSCQSSAPCQTFQKALSVTAAGGEVNCVSPAGTLMDTAINITISVTIDCHGSSGGFMGNVANGVTINVTGAVVTLRGLNLNGIYGFEGTSSAGTNGIEIQAAAVVNIEDCVIENFAQKGIYDHRTGGGTELFVKNTVVRDNIGAGIVVAAASKNSAVLDGVKSVGNAYGIAAGTGNNVVIQNSVLSENSVAGAETDGGAEMLIDTSLMSHNQTGVQPFGTVVLRNSKISFNTTGISGATSSYGNNAIFGNGSNTTPTVMPQQ